MKKFVVLLLLLSLTGVSSVSAHGDRLNSEGCHNDYEAKTYHCHDEAGNITSSRPLQKEDDDMDETESSDDMKDEDEYDSDSKMKKVEVKKIMGEQKANLKDMKNASKEEIKRLKKEAREDIKSNRDEAKSNREAFKTDNRNELKNLKSELTDEQKKSLSELGKEFKDNMEEFRDELKDSDTQTEKDAIYTDMKKLVESHYDAMEEVVADNKDAVAILQQRRNVYLENETLREENRETREEYRDEREDTIKKYKSSFHKRLGNRLENISDEKLQKLLERIDALLAKYETDGTLTEARKDKIVGQLVALKEIIEEQLENDDVEADIMDIIEEITEQ